MFFSLSKMIVLILKVQYAHFTKCLYDWVREGGQKLFDSLYYHRAEQTLPPLWLSVHLIIKLFCTCQMPSAEICCDGYHGWTQKPFQRALLDWKVKFPPVHCSPKRACRSYSCSNESKSGAQCILKRERVAKTDWFTLPMIGSIECSIYKSKK